MLTRKQTDLLLYINRRLHEDGISPSFDEMRDALGLKSKSGIHRLISGLEERGFIRRLPHRARALEVIRLPESAAISGRTTKPSVTPAPSSIGRPMPPAANDLELPLYGRIAAGTPIEALRDPDTTVRVPAGMIGRGRHYALEVAGDSMVNAGILDGDTVVIERSEDADNGSIVVALVDGEEATLKRFRRRGYSIALEPANKAYETRIFPPNRVRVQGRLIALLRRY